MTAHPFFRQLLFVCLVMAWAVPAAALPRSETPLDAVWSFAKGDITDAARPAFDDGDWRRVTLPHTFNGSDGDDGGGYYRGPAWYRTRLAEFRKDPTRRYYLTFDGAALAADVWVNGRKVGRHEGGYARFRFDVTDALADGANTVAVRVDNGKGRDIAPLGGDFTVFGGLYRPVSLVSTDLVHIDMMDHGGPGVYVSTPRVDARSAQVRVRARVSNDGQAPTRLSIVTSVRDAGGREVARVSKAVAVEDGATTDVAGEITLADPHLWNGVADPYLYSAVTTIVDAEGRERDRIETPFGIRAIRITADRGLLLNGRPYRVHGVNYFHAQRPGRGTAVTDREVSADMAIIADLGATGVRFVHYQHPQQAYDEADRRGLLVWTEIPLNGVIDPGAAFERNIEQQMRELIAQNFNHPSVMVWGLGNEVYAESDNVLRVIRAAQATAAAADPSRPTAYAHCCQADDAPKALISDLGAFNRYFGWYPDQKGTLGEWARGFHARFPDRPVAVSEYGAGGSIRHQESDPGPPVPAGPWHPEQYQALYHERNWRGIANLPFLWGSFIWVAFDLASDGRSEGDRDGINDKGLVTYDRAVRKDAYFWYQANWSRQPVLHLADSRHVYRTRAAVDVKVYTNLPKVSLQLNGREIGSVAVRDHVAIWSNILLRPGTNVVTVTGGGLRDQAQWTYDPAASIRLPPPGAIR
ncbi:glycoside hydrolase family 2 TIM barrel-domain containing protein [Sphingomonas sp. DT-204]|uniref:glycoside hydrolase family 2 protein n=1 Tax=Sphingomonas sp. DT-204 TaxID=3396166 RepID=UPI003F1BB98E